MRVFICFHADVFWGGIFTEIPIWLCIGAVAAPTKKKSPAQT